MSLRVAINGFGRIGRNVLRAIVEAKRNDITVVAINDLAPPETNAHLLRFDSIHGRFPGEVTVKGDTIDCGIGPIKVTAICDSGRYSATWWASSFGAPALIQPAARRTAAFCSNGESTCGNSGFRASAAGP